MPLRPPTSPITTDNRWNCVEDKELAAAVKVSGGISEVRISRRLEDDYIVSFRLKKSVTYLATLYLATRRQRNEPRRFKRAEVAITTIHKLFGETVFHVVYRASHAGQKRKAHETDGAEEKELTARIKAGGGLSKAVITHSDGTDYVVRIVLNDQTHFFLTTYRNPNQPRRFKKTDVAMAALNKSLGVTNFLVVLKRLV